MEVMMFNVLGVSGSLRRGSLNSALLRAAAEHAPEGMSLEIRTLNGVPVFNEDVRLEGEPAAVTSLKEAIRAADALLIATPEYNGSIPGVLKNAIDWVSRPMAESPLRDKPVALAGAGGTLGTVRAQDQLRVVLGNVSALPLGSPTVRVDRAPTKFDAEGRLIDMATLERLPKLLTALRQWSLRLRGATPGAG